MPPTLCHTGLGSEQTGKHSHVSPPRLNDGVCVYSGRKETDYIERERIRHYRERGQANEENRVTEEIDACQKTLLAKRGKKKRSHTRKFLNPNTQTSRNLPYRLALSLSSPLVSSVSVCPPHRPGFLCGALVFRRLSCSAGRPAPWPPPLACVER